MNKKLSFFIGALLFLLLFTVMAIQSGSLFTLVSSDERRMGMKEKSNRLDEGILIGMTKQEVIKIAGKNVQELPDDEGKRPFWLMEFGNDSKLMMKQEHLKLGDKEKFMFIYWDEHERVSNVRIVNKNNDSEQIISVFYGREGSLPHGSFGEDFYILKNSSGEVHVFEADPAWPKGDTISKIMDIPEEKMEYYKKLKFRDMSDKNLYRNLKTGDKVKVWFRWTNRTYVTEELLVDRLLLLEESALSES